MFRNIKRVKHIKAQTFLVGGFYKYSRRAQEDAKSRHHFTVKSVLKLPYNPRIWKTLLKAHFHQFMTVFVDCSISKRMFKKKN